ncbi:MAG: ATP-binding protein [Lachnospiraceae bacterium]|nr:ATP-binding protein [Lachnospiraceae bacterium]
MKELKIEAKVENLNNVLAFVDAELESVDCPMKVQMQLDVSVEELFVNIAHYAYTPDTGDAVIEVEFLQDPLKVKITFKDSGMPFDPTAKEDPDVTLSAQERKIGGLGIYMVKKAMDEMTYEYVDGQNILHIVKTL